MLQKNLVAILIVLVLILVVSACGPMSSSPAPIPVPAPTTAPSEPCPCMLPAGIYIKWHNPDLLAGQDGYFAAGTLHGHPFSYSASTSGGSIQQAGGQYFSVQFPNPGDYTIVVTATNACGEHSDSFAVTVRESVTGHLLTLGLEPITADYIDGGTIMAYQRNDLGPFPEFDLDLKFPGEEGNWVEVEEMVLNGITYTASLTRTTREYVILTSPNGGFWIPATRVIVVFVGDSIAETPWKKEFPAETYMVFAYGPGTLEEDRVAILHWEVPNK